MANKNKNLIATGLTAIALSTAPANAETLKTPNEVKQEVQKVKKVCETRLECIKLSNSIQAQINKLKSKGIANLSDDEFNKYAKLKERFITVEKQETRNNDNLIAVEDKKHLQQEETISRYDKKADEENNKQEKMRQTQNKKIDELRGALL